MVDMTKAEAADIIATDVRVFAREHGLTIDKALVEARMSEIAGSAFRNTYKGQAMSASARPSWRTVLRAATKDAL